MIAATLARRVTPTGVLVAPHDVPRDEWLGLRKSGIGGSDVAALLGMSKYTSPYELYLDKRGELPEIPRPDSLERAAKWGHFHEPLIAAEFARLHDVRTRRIGLIRHVDDPWRLANLDRQVHGCADGPCLLEIKNRSAYKAGEWGESGDPDGVPDSEALQTFWYLGVTGYGHAHVGVLINGNDDRYYRVERDEALISDLVAAGRLFWQRVQDGDPPPVDGSDASTDLLAQLWAGSQDAEKVVSPAEVTPLLDEVEQIKATAGELDARLKLAQNRLRAMLGDREVAIADGESLFTWKQNGQFAARRFTEAHPDLAEKYSHLVPAIDTKALAADHPDLYRAHRARVLRIPTRGETS